MPELDQQMIEVDGAALEVVTGGADAPPICQMPHPIRHRLPEGFLAELGRLVKVSPRGMGKSSAAATPHDLTVDRLVDDLEAVRHRLGIGRWWLYGSSGGGEVLLRYALRYPDAVTALIVGGCPPGFWHVLGDPRSSMSPENPQWKPLIAHLPVQPIAGMTWLRITDDRWVGSKEGQPRAVLRARSPEQGLTERQRVVFEEIIEHGSYAHELSRLPAPTLILHGRQDDTVPIRLAEDLRARLPHAELVVFEHCGHSPLSEEPEKYQEVVRRFIAGQGSSPTRAGIGPT